MLLLEMNSSNKVYLGKRGTILRSVNCSLLTKGKGLITVKLFIKLYNVYLIIPYSVFREHEDA